MQYGRQPNATTCKLLLQFLLLFLVSTIVAIGGSNTSTSLEGSLPLKSNPATFFGVDGLGSSSSSNTATKSRDVLEAELEDELRREFVRVSASHSRAPSSTYFNKKTYSLPRQFECYSCMSLIYQDNWQFLQLMYTAPKVFTNRCNEPLIQKNIPTVLCGSICVTLLEPNVEAGVFLGYKYIRGCEDRILRHGFNQSALKTHRFIQVDQQCRHLPRANLFNQPRHVQMSVFGDVQLCTCYGDKCNGASAASSSRHRLCKVLSGVLLTWILWLATFIPPFVA